MKSVLNELNDLMVKHEPKKIPTQSHKTTPKFKINVEYEHETKERKAQDLMSEGYKKMIDKQKYEVQILQLRERIKQLESKLEHSEHENKTLKLKLKEHVKTDIENNNKLISKMRDKIDSLHNENKSLKSKLESYQNKYKDFQIEVQSFEEFKQNQLQLLKQKKREFEEEMEQQYKKLNSAQLKFERYKQQITDEIQAYREKPELKFRGPYPEYFQTQVKAMEQSEKFKRDLTEVHNTGELDRAQIEENYKTEEVRNRPAVEYERQLAIKKRQIHNKLLAIAKNKHYKYKAAQPIIFDYQENRGYYLMELANNMPEGSEENDTNFMKYIRCDDGNVYLYISPKY